MTLISVIIPAYNAAGYVRGAIGSVLAQTAQNFEIIIVDDGSQDGTRKVIEPFLDDSRIRYFFQKNRGLPGARNSGAKISRGDYLAFLDSDDFFAPNALESMLRRFQETGAAWLNVGVLKVNGAHRVVRQPNIPEGDLFLAILENDFITRSPFYPRKEFFDIGMYDEEIRMREDWDLNIRMIAARRPFALLEEPLYFYTRTEGSITTGNLHKLLTYTEKLLIKHHKTLADSGNREARTKYASNMWQLARRYLYEGRDPRQAFRCAAQSALYDPSPYRLFHPIVHRFRLILGKD